MTQKDPKYVKPELQGTPNAQKIAQNLIRASVTKREQQREAGRMYQKRRKKYAFGDDHHNSKYSEKLIRTIRAAVVASQRMKGHSVSYRIIAAIYSVPMSLVSNCNRDDYRKSCLPTEADIVRVLNDLNVALAQRDAYEDSVKTNARAGVNQLISGMQTQKSQMKGKKFDTVQTGDPQFDEIFASLQGKVGNPIKTYKDYMLAINVVKQHDHTIASQAIRYARHAQRYLQG